MNQQNHRSKACASMTSIVTENDVSHVARRGNILRLKNVHVIDKCKRLRKSNFWLEFFSAMAESWKKPKTSNLVLSFMFCSNCNTQ